MTTAHGPAALPRHSALRRTLTLGAALGLWECLLLPLTQVGPSRPAELAAGLAVDALTFGPALLCAFVLSGKLLWRRGMKPSALLEAVVSTLAVNVLFTVVAFARVLWAPEGLSQSLCAAGAAPGGFADTALSLLAAHRGVLLLQAPVLPLIYAALVLRGRRRIVAGAVLTCVASVALVLPGGGYKPPPPSVVQGCLQGSPVRRYDVSAVSVPIPLNRFGDYDPQGAMYVLDEELPKVQAQLAVPFPDRVSVGLRKDAIAPLVLRANLGECLEIGFTNRLDEPASLHVHGLSHTVENAGGQVGFNPDTHAAPGGTLRYRIPMPSAPEAEGSYFFRSGGAARTLQSHGLFGVVVAEPAGAQYLDVETGGPLRGNHWEATIVPPLGPAFREFVVIYHEVGDEDFDDFRNAALEELPVVSDFLDIYRPGSRALNYRSEPFHRRLELLEDEGLAYGSYTFGDPATPIPRSYLGDPAKTRIVHAGGETFHVHHLHGGATRWPLNPRTGPSMMARGLDKNPESTASVRRDAQTIGPGTAYSLEHECGSGGCQQAAGDFLYHCHIGHHYLAGMWSFWRVFDTRQPDLAPLPDRAPPPSPVTSLGLVGKVVGGKTLVPAAALRDPGSQLALEAHIEAQLPPPGRRLDSEDATVWDWQKVETANGPLYLGEPEDTREWANYRSPTPGQRPEILFNPQNGRYAWPLLRPHLKQRPPFTGKGHTGAPWLGETATASRPDGLCPINGEADNAWRKRRAYAITAIDVPVPISRQQVDVRGRVFVLAEDKQAVQSGARPPEPLVIRSNSGDCVDVFFTNELSRKNEAGHPSKANLHTHFVQFDPQASDGVVAGLSFEQTLLPLQTEARWLTAPAAPGAQSVQVNHTRRLRPGIWVGVGLGRGVCADPSSGQERACAETRRIAAIQGKVLILDAPLELAHAADERVGVEFMRANWFSDVDTGTVFFHTHVDFRDWQHGLMGMHIVEPRGSTWLHPETGQPLRSGAIADIYTGVGIAPAQGITGSFREVALAFMEGTTSSPLGAIESSVNLRAEPWWERPGPNAWRFSSFLHGDPRTPLPRAYVGDPMVFRVLGMHEATTGVRLTGHRFIVDEWLHPDGALGDTSVLGVSERTNVALGAVGGPGGFAGDYLYYSTLQRHWEAGAWGLLRVHEGAQPDLRPLPDRPAPPPGTAGAGTGSGTPGAGPGAPPQSTGPGQPCPATAPVRRFDLRVNQARIIYERDHWEDSDGVVFQFLDAPRPKRLEVADPLILRVNQGDCVEVSLKNELAEPASFHLGGLDFDPHGSFGAAVGFNEDSSTRPGQTRLYRFFASAEPGLAMALNLASPRTGGRGAFAAMVVEPEGAQWRHPLYGGELRSGAVADIIGPGFAFREAVLLFHDEDPRIGFNDMPYATEVDKFAGLNFAVASFEERLRRGPPAQVFSSARHGDPRLVVRAFPGDPVVLRVGQPFGEQAHVFGVDGHLFATDQLPHTSHQAAQNLVPGVGFAAALEDGAGSVLQAPGDYLLADLRWPFFEAGLWGLLRVVPEGTPGLLTLPLQQAPPVPAPGGQGGGASGATGATGGAGSPDPGAGGDEGPVGAGEGSGEGSGAPGTGGGCASAPGGGWVLGMLLGWTALLRRRATRASPRSS